MKNRQFFAVVWRINSVVILAAGVVGLFVLLFAAAAIYKEMTRTRQATGVVNIAEEQVDLAKASIGDFHLVEGTNVLRAPLYLEQEYAFGSGSKETSSTQNYLYFGLETRDAYWLIPGHRGLILETNEFPSREYGEEEKRAVVAVMYILVDEDTNGDGKLTRNDSKVIAMSDATGKQFARLLTKVEEINGAHLKNGSLLIFFTSESTLRMAEVELATINVVRESVVKPLKQEIQQQIPRNVSNAARP